jgi:uncharacterized membrane protein
MYFDIASVVSLFSVVVIFAMLYMRSLADRHKEEMDQERRSRDFEEMYRSLDNVENHLSRKIESLERDMLDNMRNTEDAIVTSTRSRRTK